MRINMTDWINFLSKLTFRRFINALKVVCSYYFSKLTKKPYHWGMPLSIAIEPTTHCNLRCPECLSGLRSFTRPTGSLEEDLFRKILDELSENLLYLNLSFQGEPYLHPEFLNMVKYAAGKGIYTSTSTNAHFLDDENAKKTVESGLDRIIISIDGTTQETYSSYRVGGDLNKVIDGTKNIIKWKKNLHSRTPHIIFQFLVIKPNELQVDDIIELGKKVGVDEVRLKTAQVYDYVHGNPLIPGIEKYSRYTPLRPSPKWRETQGAGLPPRSKSLHIIKNKLPNYCWKLWHSCVITWDGIVVPCCFDKDAGYSMGNLKEEIKNKGSFNVIWNNKKYQDFRTSILLSRNNIEICCNCSEGILRI
ncbi:MAG: radical SAM/SPASM domain-containing protein [Bacteroidota bacterium]